MSNNAFIKEATPLLSVRRSIALEAVIKRNEAIRRERRAGATVDQLARKYGVDRSTVEKLHGKS